MKSMNQIARQIKRQKGSGERESTPLTTEIRLKIPRNRYLDAGLSAYVKKAEKHMP
jgi:hypothetical protein